MNGERKEEYLDWGKPANNECERWKALRRLLKASLLRELTCSKCRIAGKVVGYFTCLELLTGY